MSLEYEVVFEVGLGLHGGDLHSRSFTSVSSPRADAGKICDCVASSYR